MNKRYPIFSQILINKKRHICSKDISVFCLELLKLTVYVLQGNPVICRYTWYDIYREITRIHRHRLCHAGPGYIGARCDEERSRRAVSDRIGTVSIISSRRTACIFGSRLRVIQIFQVSLMMRLNYKKLDSMTHHSDKARFLSNTA